LKKWLSEYKSSNISEMWQDSTKVTIEHRVSKYVHLGVVIYLFLVSHSVCF